MPTLEEDLGDEVSVVVELRAIGQAVNQEARGVQLLAPRLFSAGR